MAEAIFKSFQDLNDYLNEMDMIDMEELTEALIADADADAEED